jgi:hypothetical protein
VTTPTFRPTRLSKRRILWRRADLLAQIEASA